MKTKPFDINEAKDGAKVVTRDGHKVRLVCFDAPDNISIYGFIEGDILIRSWKYSGDFNFDGRISDLDLFLVSEEEGLTEFEKTLIAIMNKDLPEQYQISNQLAKCYSQELLELARKELYKEIENDLESVHGETIISSCKQSYEQGRTDALKGLPKWKKTTKKEHNYLACGFLSHDGYYLDIQELEDKLPKENDNE